MSESGLSSVDAAAAAAVDVEDSSDMSLLASAAGAQLAAARIRSGLSIQQVADQLKLSQRQVAAIESSQFDDLPAMVIVRGFVRSYAKLLKLDAAPLVGLLPVESISLKSTDLRPTLDTPFMESRTPFLGKQDAYSRKYLIGAAMLAVFALVFVLAQKVEQSEYLKNLFARATVQKAADAAAGVAQVAAASSVAATASQPDMSASTVVQSLSTPLVEVKADSHEPASTVVAKSPMSDVPASTPLVAPVSLPALPVSASHVESVDQVRFKFRQDSWIQVKRANGTVLTSHLAKAGTEEVFDAKEPLQVRIGNAAGVDAWLRGSPVEIAPAKDSNVVNLSVK
ncbi:helix-turn-helix domain-containing protein [Undibacterium sp. SXout7W]|uniref:helix-turn-helix domain-containing protein n=1 Tax=Undibacterium sp. SXout7W TaxID=3413049 RepID=UPI003BF3868E